MKFYYETSTVKEILEVKLNKCTGSGALDMGLTTLTFENQL